MLRLFKKSIKTGIVTTSYPEQPDFPAEGFRGLPVWAQEKCRRCGNCAEVCLSGAITVRQEDFKNISGVLGNSRASANSGITGTADASNAWDAMDDLDVMNEYWTLDPKRCLFCGYCAEDCPSGAITLGREFELAERAEGSGNSEDQGSSGNAGTGSVKPESENVKKIFDRSVHIRHLDAGSCNGCDWEMTTLTGPVYDVQRLGFDFVASPRHADILMVTGPVTRNLEIAALKTYRAAPAPKLVVAVGTCACSGGICGKNYTSAGGVNQILPVDVYIPGCPPRPQALIQGLLKAVGR